MASFDRIVLQRLLGAVPTRGTGLFSGRRVSGGNLMPRVKPRSSMTCMTTPQGEGWSWSERVAPFGVREVRVVHHALGTSICGAAVACPAQGWGMVVAGCATLNMRRHARASIHSETLLAGDVWSVPASAVAWFHCEAGEQASVVAFMGGREPDKTLSAFPEICADDVPSGVSFHHRLQAQEAQHTAWGSLRVVEAAAFSDPDALSAALVEIEPGCQTDLHWHLNTSVWQICLDGAGCLNSLPKGGGQQNASLCPGMMAYVPRGEGYLIRNHGAQVMKVLEIFRSDHYHDLSLAQWLAACSAEDIAAHLCVDVAVVADLAVRESVFAAQASTRSAGYGTH